MTDTVDELEKLLTDVRKTISDNKQFLAKLVDEEDVEDDSEESTESLTAEEDFEEL